MALSSNSPTKIQLNYRKKGTWPPMYLAGDFTTPPWQLLDMDFVKLGSPLDAIEDVDYLFFKDIQVAEGTWQYKFRVGDSSWWVLNEDRETVLDSIGNTNNVLLVRQDKIAPIYGYGEGLSTDNIISDQDIEVGLKDLDKSRFANAQESHRLNLPEQHVQIKAQAEHGVVENVEAIFLPKDLPKFPLHQSTNKILEYHFPRDYALPIIEQKFVSSSSVSSLGFPTSDKTSSTSALIVAANAEEAENAVLPNAPVPVMVYTNDISSHTTALNRRAAGSSLSMDRRYSSIAHLPSESEPKYQERKLASSASSEGKFRAPSISVDPSSPLLCYQGQISPVLAENLKRSSEKDLSQALLDPNEAGANIATENQMPNGRPSARPGTPNSINSVQEAKVPGMLRSIWRLVCQGWIGGVLGFFSKLFWRHDT